MPTKVRERPVTVGLAGCSTAGVGHGGHNGESGEKIGQQVLGVHFVFSEIRPSRTDALAQTTVVTMASPSPCLQFVRRVTNAFLHHAGHDATCLSSLRIHTATPGNIVGTMKVEQHNVNRLNTLHGGVICSLTDTMGSLALASKGLYSTGVSTDIHSTFVKPAQLGEEVTVAGKVISLGKTLATTRVEIRHLSTDAILAYGSHTKFIGKAMAHPENVEFNSEGSQVTKGKPVSEWAED